MPSDVIVIATVAADAGDVKLFAASTSTIESPLANNRFAHAPAIAVGTMLAALGM